MNRYSLTALSVAGGILSGLAWTRWFPGLILLFAFVPYFLIENHLYLNQTKYGLRAYFTYLLPGFVIFCIISLGWVRVANIPAAIAIILEMSFLMSFILWLAHVVRVKAGNCTGLIALISFWLAFEYLSLHSVYLSPWINLGNGLAKDILFIQWYEITGVSGGTLWILVSNLLFTAFLINNYGKKRLAVIWALFIIIPSSLSIFIYFNISGQVSSGNEVVIIQPNTDPFTEKYVIPFEDQLNGALAMADNSITERTEWLLLPETIIDDPVNEADIKNNSYMTTLREFVLKHPGVNIIAGLVSYIVYPGADKAPTRSAVKTDTSEYFLDHFNSAFRIDTGVNPDIYHKSKLVPGIEMQFSAALGKLSEIILPDMGGTIWGYGSQDTRTCFTHSLSDQTIAPVICYESVFGNFVADFVREGAEAIFIITNDGWWKNTNGYLHHLSYASIRAIETRRPVARCANTGVSCITDIRGKRIQETAWRSKDTLTGNIVPGTGKTFYVRYGDYLSASSMAAGIIILLYTLFFLSVKKKPY